MMEKEALNKYKMSIRSMLSSFEGSVNRDNLVANFIAKYKLSPEIHQTLYALVELSVDSGMPTARAIEKIVRATIPREQLVQVFKHTIRIEYEIEADTKTVSEKEASDIRKAFEAALSNHKKIVFVSVNP